MIFPFPAEKTTFDDVAVTVDGRSVPTVTADDGIAVTPPLAAHAVMRVRFHYVAHGLSTWRYAFGSNVTSVHDFALTMRTNFDAIDFPVDTLAPTTKATIPGGRLLTWRYHDLVAGHGIGMQLPERLQPGPLAQRMAFWAPLSLCFYVFVMLVITTLRRIDLHPVNYFFLAAAFFAFDLLFAYLVDRIALELAFAISAVVSLALTISYLRLVVDLRFAAFEAGGTQVFYQILFALALFDEGSSGLAITIGAIVTLFVTMQATGGIRWTERLAAEEAAERATATSRVPSSEKPTFQS